MGNNGGFHPFRDANGEFTDPAGSGKPGRSRARGAGGSASASGRKGLPQRAFTGSTRVRGANLVGPNLKRMLGDAVGPDDIDQARALWVRYNTKPNFPTAANDPRSGGNLTGTGYKKKQ